ncbi:hypothetical protein ACT3CE_17635 [Marinifilum sp. RC60d5]|uniref:hypothetical protein n=1 Tax=Marinifilum sp. RC60d5 TaxID=3458414 RepID=UPI004035F5A8
MSKQIWYNYLDKKESEEFNEYNSYIADFEEDLNEISLEGSDTYDWDYFLIDIISFMIPFLIICLGLSLLTFTIFQFSEQLKTISLRLIFKSTFLAYFIFFIKDIASCIWFILIKKDYQLEDIRVFHKTINPSISDFWVHPNPDSWINFFLEDINILFILFTITILILVKNTTKHNIFTLSKYLYFSIVLGLILYETLMMYILL